MPTREGVLSDVVRAFTDSKESADLIDGYYSIVCVDESMMNDPPAQSIAIVPLPPTDAIIERAAKALCDLAVALEPESKAGWDEFDEEGPREALRDCYRRDARVALDAALTPEGR